MYIPRFDNIKTKYKNIIERPAFSNIICSEIKVTNLIILGFNIKYNKKGK